jgi:hypothetical protein
MADKTLLPGCSAKRFSRFGWTFSIRQFSAILRKMEFFNHHSRSPVSTSATSSARGWARVRARRAAPPRLHENYAEVFVSDYSYRSATMGSTLAKGVHWLFRRCRSGFRRHVDHLFRADVDQIGAKRRWVSASCTTLIQVVKQISESKGTSSASLSSLLGFSGFAGAKFAPAAGLC